MLNKVIKIVVFFLFSVQFIWSADAQNLSFKIFAEDATGRKDTVQFGFNDSSTLNKDAQFGEKNIFGSPFDSLDIRVIQRDSIHFNCLHSNEFSLPGNNLYFPSTFDSKSNFKPFVDRDPLYVNFEFMIRATHYPVILRSDFSAIKLSYLDSYSSIFLLDSNCSWLAPATIYLTRQKQE